MAAKKPMSLAQWKTYFAASYRGRSMGEHFRAVRAVMAARTWAEVNESVPPYYAAAAANQCRVEEV